MMPDGIVELEGLGPVADGSQGGARDADHGRHRDGGARSPISIARSATRARATTWSDGIFHANLPSTAVVSDCNGCHYPLIADAAAADNQQRHALRDEAPVAADAESAMQAVPHHGRGEPRDAAGDGRRCLRAALFTPRSRPPRAFRYPSPPAASIVTWSRSQPRTFRPRARSPTRFKAGGTSTNGAQWMNHGSSLVAGKDCAACHLADAQPTGSVWSRSISLHSAAPLARTCQECHGLVNGGGGTPAPRTTCRRGSPTRRSSPRRARPPASRRARRRRSPTTTSTSPARDCNFCHSQAGVSTVASIQGKEWAQARFHLSFPASTPLTMNGGNGRCSNCHMNDNPKSSYTVFNHSNFNNSSSSTDCSSLPQLSRYRHAGIAQLARGFDGGQPVGDRTVEDGDEDGARLLFGD